MKPTLAEAANLYVPAYLALIERGFAVTRESIAPNQSDIHWIAEDADRRYVADDPLTLLDMVALVETRGADWEASDPQIDTFLEEFGVDW